MGSAIRPGGVATAGGLITLNSRASMKTIDIRNVRAH